MSPAVPISDPDLLAITTIGSSGSVIGMDTFGASAPLKALQTKFGFTPEAAVAAARSAIERAR